MTKKTLTPIAPGVFAHTDDVGLNVVSNVRAYPLDHVHANPWQTRLSENSDHVRSLADDILRHDLLQVPLARPHPTLPGHVQLAFGHSRLAAYKLLHGENYPVTPRFDVFPVDVRELGDRQLSDLAAAENAQRNDLTAIEKATAIQRRMKDFGLGQLDAGAPFGLKTQGAVANLLSLLKLPDELRTGVASGEIPQRLARQAVTLSQLLPKETTAAMRTAAQAPTHQREDAVRNALSDVLERKGRDIRDAAFTPDWPAQTISLNGASLGDLIELPACYGCEFFYKRESEMFCLRPACYDAKHQRALDEHLLAASLKTGAPVLDKKGKGESGQDVFKHFYWSEAQHMKKLIAAGKRDPAFGLRVTPIEKSESGGHYWDDFTGSTHVKIVTVNLAACAKFIKALEAAPDSKAAAKTGAVVVSSAALDAEREARREEKAAKLRLVHDVVWLVQSVTPVIAEQLTISGPILHYVCAQLLQSHMSEVSDFFGLQDWYTALEAKAEKATGKDADTLRRQQLVASQIFGEAFTFNLVKDDGCWDEIVEAIQSLATAGKSKRWGDNTLPGWGVKLSKRWQSPPVHHTDYNCWHCGRFASNRRLTKLDIEAGWVAITDALGNATDVFCPTCAPKSKKA